MKSYYYTRSFLIIILLGFTITFISCSSNSTSSNDEIVYGTVTDNDGKEYRTVEIGNQEWMADDLWSSTYQDGSDISRAISLSDVDIELLKKGYRVGNQITQVYNWYAVMDPRGICPEGWVVPDNDEWNTLVSYLGENAGGQLKENSDQWESPNKGANNSTGFSARPGGNYLSKSYGFAAVGYIGYYWTATESDDEKAVVRYMKFDEKNVFKEEDLKRFGASVRCIKDNSN